MDVNCLHVIDKPPTKVIRPQDLCLAVLCIRCKYLHVWGMVWLACTTVGIQIIIVVFALPCSLFYQTGTLHEKLLAADPSYCWLYPSKQAVDCFMLFVCLYHVLFFHLDCSIEQVLAVDPFVHTVGTGRLLIVMSMNNLKSPMITAKL